MADNQIVVLPSTLHQFAFCPRQVFFDYYFKAPKPLSQKIRMWIGKLLHFFHHLLRRGYVREELLKVGVDEVDGIVLVGKPDCYKVDRDTVILEEFKSSRMPKKPGRFGVLAWESDVVQTLAYAYMLQKAYGMKVFIVIRYIDGATAFDFNEFLCQELLHIIGEYKAMVEHRILPETPRSRKCSKCQYKELCDILDS